MGYRGRASYLPVVAVVALLSSGCAYVARASINGSGVAGNGASFTGALSGDGREVVFASAASDLVSGDTNGSSDVFVRDLKSNVTERVSVDSSGTQANGASGGEDRPAAISPDGRFVAFVSDATNLVPGDTNGRSDVFIRDRQTGTTERVSVATGGDEGNDSSGASGPVAVSSDGRFVAFASDADNLVSGDTNGSSDVFVRDRQTDTTERVSVASDGTEGDSYADSPAMSADGRYVAFESAASNLVPGDTNASMDVFVRDRQTGTTTRVDTDGSGGQANGQSSAPAISADGRYVAFSSDASNLVPGDTNSKTDVFVKDTQTGAIVRASVSGTGGQGNGASDSVAIDGAGDRVAFRSFSTTLVAGDGDPSNGEIYVRNLAAGTTILASTTESLTPVTLGGVPGENAISADGRYVAFTSDAAGVIGVDANGTADVYVRAVPVPMVSNIVPAAVAPGSSNVPVTISGSGFVGTPSVFTVLSPPDGVTFANVIVVDDSTITATVTIAPSAASGPRNVWVADTGTGPGVNNGSIGVCAGCFGVPATPVNTAAPTIGGVARDGQTLTVSTGSWTGAPTTFTYAWNRCSPSCVPIAGATSSTLDLTVADVGSTITATVVASNGAGDSAPATSAPTSVVVASIPQVQTIAAGTSATNLPTENVWAGAQNPPYICCWGSQGQYVTFSFSVNAGSTNLALRYSAGNGVAHRKIELDGSVWVADQAFAATADWNTWTTLTLNQPALAAGPHTLKVWFDSAAGSDQYINLDNLTVTEVVVAPPPAGVVVSAGYADSAIGLTPWSGSPGTIFIGEPAQCCSTHGPNNGGVGYDAGAIEVSNTSASSVTVDSVTVDFGGGSSPSHFDLWGGSTTPHLPQTLAPGARLVLTMTSSFNFDTSDLFGEACHINSGVAGVVHVTLNGSLTDYQDSHQILNSDGADLASCPGDVSEEVPFTALAPGAQPAALPVNDITPSVTGAGPASAPRSAVTGRVLSGFAGGWNASPPPALSLQWTRCDTSGDNCNTIAGATDPTYRPTSNDVGSTLRLQVTASNASGSVAASSAPTSIVQSGPAVAQLGHTVTGFTSAFVYDTTELSWTMTATASGTTNDFAFFARGAGNDQVFTPKIYGVVNGQKGALLATGAPVTVPRGTDGMWYVSALGGLQLTSGTQYVFGLDPSGSFNGTYVGGEPNGEPSFFVNYAPA